MSQKYDHTSQLQRCMCLEDLNSAGPIMRGLLDQAMRVWRSAECDVRFYNLQNAVKSTADVVCKRFLL